jgi:hypothetical protein
MINKLMETRRMMFSFLRLVFYLFLIIISIGAIPSFLQSLVMYQPNSMDLVTEIAKSHLESFVVYLCEVLGLVVAFRTYRLIFKGAAYAIMVPGACLSEASPLKNFMGGCSIGCRFAFGLATWFVVLAGAIWVAVISVSSSESDSTYNASASNTALLVFIELLSLHFAFD